MSDINVEAVIVEISKLELTQNNILVIKINRNDFTHAQVIRLVDEIKAALPPGVTAMMITKEMELEVIEQI